MKTVSVLFSRKHNIGALVLRVFQWSPWSHVAIIDGDYVIEATATHGVRRVTIQEAMEHVTDYEIVHLPCANPEVAIAAAASQIGKKYDWGMILGHPLRQDWDDMDRWVCSELVAWAVQQGGTELFRTKPHRITPQHLYLPRFNAGDLPNTVA